MEVTKHRAIFLDRDGTLIVEKDYLTDAGQIELLPGAITAIRRINAAGRLAILITNQSAVARGFLSLDGLADIHHCLEQQILAQRARLDRIYFCPHHPRLGEKPFRRECRCRKPRPGLFRLASRQWNIDLERSYMIGDKLEDIEAGHRAGCRSILVRTGYGAEAVQRLEQTSVSATEDTKKPNHPECIASDILQAVEWILESDVA